MAVNLVGVILLKILENPVDNLDHWSALRSNYIPTEYSSLYDAIDNYLTRYNKLPNFDSLEMSISRNNRVLDLLYSTKQYEDTDIDLEAGIEALENQYAQDSCLVRVDKLLDSIVMLDSEEIKLELTTIVQELEDQTNNSSTMCLMNDIKVIPDEGSSSKEYVPLGFSNYFDSEVRAFTSDLIMLGGYRGAGKSIVCTNITDNQYKNGNVGLYFTIEMPREEVFHRMLADLASVKHDNLRKDELTDEDLDSLATVRMEMFTGTDEVYEEYLEKKDYKAFENKLIRDCDLKQDNQIIIVDNQTMTLADIDMATHKIKAKFGNKLKVIVVDYVNQISIDDMYNWKVQIGLSKQLKNIARKHQVVVFSPYQIDKSGEARFAKGLLDAADIAMNLSNEKQSLQFKSTKIRGSSAFDFHNEMDWDHLRILPADFAPQPDVEEEDEMPAKANESKKEELPW